ncbi:putative membrane protein/domain protein [Hyella patelloides LEGE 07179]|uniref:Putative membrane protein/domain protein n=1 Tax=Hyella patelloides LEGE 07179 TaxID=945734 RepID=A0A563VJ75_9CYAN|nr:RDD family protein [Hyella patelloides]VEP11506.1 putative membrane protein/domain protein [Hyella patelloides LEGE 07179]
MSLFNRINLETPESVELEFTLAGIGNRAYALVIDYLILGGVLALSLIIFIFLSYQVSASNLLVENKNDIVKWLWAIEILIVFAIYVGYFCLFETIWQGQTPGKKRASIRVIADNGRTINLSQAVLRALLRPIDDLLFMGMFLIALTKKEKRIGDIVAGTLVVQEDKPQKSKNISITPEAKSLAIKLNQEANISLLSPENFAVIRNYLQRRDMMSSKAHKEVARKLALQVKEIIHLEEIPEGTTARLFLEAIYLGYKNDLQ